VTRRRIVKDVPGITQTEAFENYSAVGVVTSIAGITVVPIPSTPFRLT
jgi:hypothetical protein